MRRIVGQVKCLLSSRGTFDKIEELRDANRAYMDQIITHRMGVDEIQRAFELFFGGETGKVVIEQ